VYVSVGTDVQVALGTDVGTNGTTVDTDVGVEVAAANGLGKTLVNIKAPTIPTIAATTRSTPHPTNSKLAPIPVDAGFC
jgi:hypothetical protein